MSPADHHQARRLALQVLCTLDVQGEGAWPDIERFLAEQSGAPAMVEAARGLARGTMQRQGDWDAMIGDVSLRWDLKRMGLVDRSILRLGLHEMFGAAPTPAKVAIDEAIELAKEFGGEESPAFVNGVLDAVWKKKRQTIDERGMMNEEQKTRG